jgi:hypothetical protein
VHRAPTVVKAAEAAAVINLFCFLVCHPVRV